MNNKSLYSIISVIIIFVVGTILSLFFTYNYFNTKNKLYDNLEHSSTVLLSIVKESTLPFINSYSINEYENIMETHLQDKRILAIVIEDFVTGNLINEEYITGKTRDENWNIIDYTKHNKLVETNYLYKEELISIANQKIAKIKIYLSYKFLDNELKYLILKSVLTTLVISSILIILLFFTLQKYVLNSLNKLMYFINHKNKDGLPKGQISIHTSKEFESLSLTLNDMIKQIRTSKNEIKTLNERFQLTLDSVNDGIWDWDVVTDKAFFSTRWKSMLGYEENDLKNEGKAFFELIHDDDKPFVNTLLEKHFTDPNKYQYSIKVRLRCKDGSFKWILSRGKAIFDKDNKPIRMLGYHSDITEQKEKDKKIKEQDKIIEEQLKLASMGEMIGNIAHQWRQPLSVISTAASSIKLKIELKMLNDNDLIDISNLIVNQSQYLSKTIDDFKNFIKDDIKLEKLSLKTVLNSSIQLTNATLENNYIKLISNIDDDIEIFGSKNELEQAFINILNNSKDAIKENIENQENRYIFITTKKINNNKLELTILDNGGGIPENIINRIFEPYFTTKHQSTGTGLGLSMVDKIIRSRHHQDINVQNKEFEYENKKYKGTYFIITFTNNEI